MVYESWIPVGLWECLCSTGMTVKQIPECHTLNRNTCTGRTLWQTAPLLCQPSTVLQNSSALSGRTLRQSGRFKSESRPKLLVDQICYRKPGLSSNTTGSCYFPNKVHLRLVAEEVMGTSWSGGRDGKTLLMVAPSFLLNSHSSTTSPAQPHWCNGNNTI